MNGRVTNRILFFRILPPHPPIVTHLPRHDVLLHGAYERIKRARALHQHHVAGVAGGEELLLDVPKVGGGGERGGEGRVCYTF